MKTVGYSPFLSRVNPSVKLVFHLIMMVLISVISDPLTSFLCMLIPAMITFIFIRIPIKQMVMYVILPFFILFLLSFWGIFAFAKGETVWFSWGWFHITEEGLFNGLTIGFRTLSYLFYGLIFVLTTDVTEFILSLMHQLKMKPKWAYSILAGVRFIPIFKAEFEQIRAAHRIRRVHRVGGLVGKMRSMIRFTIPLLSQGIRKSERVAIALEARNFDGSWNRTFYRKMGLGRVDVCYISILTLMQMIIIFLSSYFGFIQWGLLT
ncbi:energy-coupling factor transporter transmembrane protein EcfT [Bacillus sp. V3B]|uniref:energy-coupling factor transporter transmembrane component T family protein n=1 Tax=Bacillus sp. V3B TaxID=2804915 RepID=UPI00210B2F01|nr:energy-coupling factor transporter transmembrane component T [Bacillus sp. V3B]MCQ6275570.1 energy-coupling factor transporter transmembrane protein EcfT [Bacillus sp. V3B]